MTLDPAQWGVRLERVGAAIVVAPAGVLDGDQVDRLRRVLRSREASYTSAVIDLRELEGIGPGGVELLVELQARAQDVAFVAGPTARAELEAAGVAGELSLHDDIEPLLEPHRGA